MAKFCQKCGNQLDDNAAFCNACGAQFGGGAAMPAFISNYANNISTRVHWLIAFAAQFLCLIIATLPLIGSGNYSASILDLLGETALDATAGSVFEVLFILGFIAAAVYMILPIALEKPFDFKALLPINIAAIVYFIYNVIMIIYICSEAYGDVGLSVWGWIYILVSLAAIADLVLFSLKFKSQN